MGNDLSPVFCTSDSQPLSSDIVDKLADRRRAIGRGSATEFDLELSKLTTEGIADALCTDNGKYFSLMTSIAMLRDAWLKDDIALPGINSKDDLDRLASDKYDQLNP